MTPVAIVMYILCNYGGLTVTKTTYEPSASTSVMECKDCGFKTMNAATFNDHAHQCKAGAVPVPSAEVERREHEPS